MAHNPFFSDASIKAAQNAQTARVNGGFVVIYTGSQPGDANQALTGTLLAKLPLSSPAFGGATASGATGSRVVTSVANAITSALAVATGTAGYFAVLKSDSVTVEWTGSVGVSGADLNLSSLSITSGQSVSNSSLSLTENE